MHGGDLLYTYSRTVDRRARPVALGLYEYRLIVARARAARFRPPARPMGLLQPSAGRGGPPAPLGPRSLLHWPPMARTKTRSLAELLTLLLVRHSVAAAALPDLWPRPSQIDTSAAEDTLPIRFKNISFTLGADTPDGVLRKAAARYTAIIMASASFHLSRTQAAQKVGRGQTFVVSVEVADPSSPLSPGPGMNESYALEVQAPGPVLSLDPTATPCKLSAQTVWGALRGMETLAQLAHPAAGAADSLEIDGPVTITDTPRFGWRGMM